jgi:hypothetical protein
MELVGKVMGVADEGGRAVGTGALAAMVVAAVVEMAEVIQVVMMEAVKSAAMMVMARVVVEIAGGQEAAMVEVARVVAVVVAVVVEKGEGEKAGARAADQLEEGSAATVASRVAEEMLAAEEVPEARVRWEAGEMEMVETVEAAASLAAAAVEKGVGGGVGGTEVEVKAVARVVALRVGEEAELVGVAKEVVEMELQVGS